MVESLRRVREITDLPASVARLEVRHGAVVSILQPERTVIHWSEAGGVYLHDPIDLRSTLLARVPGWIRRATPAPDQKRVAVFSLPANGPYHTGTISIIGRDGALLASEPRSGASDCVWFGDDLAIATCFRSKADTECAQIWSADLTRKLAILPGESSGLELDAAGGLLAVGCAHDHLLWRPVEDSPFSLMRSAFAPPSEVSGGVLSRDGRLSAVAHHARGDEPQALIYSTDSPMRAAEIADPRAIAQLDFSPSGAFLAALLPEPAATILRRDERGKLVAFDDPTPAAVRVYRSADGSVVGEIPNPNARTLAWLDDETLLLGGRTLSAWTW
ncbi:MAG: hypothetical protein AAGE52_20835 [Myxococcota bacterium]